MLILFLFEKGFGDVFYVSDPNLKTIPLSFLFAKFLQIQSCKFLPKKIESKKMIDSIFCTKTSVQFTEW